MKLNTALIVLFVGLFCMPAISLERRVSYDNGRWVEIPMNEKRGVVITDNPDDGMHYTGGIVSSGRKLYADLPDDRTHKYLKVKYSPVKHRPLVDTLKTNAEIVAVADEIKTDMKDTQTINQSETRRKMWKAYIDNMDVPKDADWHGYYYMPKTYEDKFLPNIVGLIGVGLLFFLIPLSIVWKRNKHTRIAMILTSVASSVISVAIANSLIVYVASWMICMLFAIKTKRKENEKRTDSRKCNR